MTDMEGNYCTYINKVNSISKQSSDAIMLVYSNVTECHTVIHVNHLNNEKARHVPIFLAVSSHIFIGDEISQVQKFSQNFC